MATTATAKRKTAAIKRLLDHYSTLYSYLGGNSDKVLREWYRMKRYVLAWARIFFKHRQISLRQIWNQTGKFLGFCFQIHHTYHGRPGSLISKSCTLP